MLKVLKYFLAALLIAAIGAYIYMAARLNERDRKDIVCNEISIVIQNDDECDFIRKEDIAEYITEKYGECAGRKIAEIDCGELENILSGIDAIKGCECYTDRSGKLNIEVYQREPVLRIVNREGKGWYSDANGYLFPVYGSHVPRIMAVTGDIPDSDEWMSGLVELNGFISSDPYWKNMIVQMDIEGNGDIVLIPQDGRMKIIFGKLGNTKDKFYRIKRFYDSVLPVSEGKYSEISVKYRNQIVCKKTK